MRPQPVRLLFATGNSAAANVGRLLQGAGGAFALVGAVYIVSTSFPLPATATLVGATQMFGSSGASAGQFLVGPMIAGGVIWSTLWLGLGVIGIAVAGLLWFLLPKAKAAPAASQNWLKDSLDAMILVFRNPQSIFCGLIAGLLFIPTTIFDMIWGVRFLQEAHGFDYGSAVIRSATIPLGWIIGCPLLGFIADRIGRRKPVCRGRLLCASGVPRMDPLRTCGRITSLYARHRGGYRVGSGDDPIHHHQGSEPSSSCRHCNRGCRLPELHVQRPSGSRFSDGLWHSVSGGAKPET